MDKKLIIKNQHVAIFNGRQGNALDNKIKTYQDIEDERNAMAYINRNYPLSISDCEVVGINGDCGIECPVFLAGKCDVEDTESFIDEIINYGNIDKIKKLYPNIKEFQIL